MKNRGSLPSITDLFAITDADSVWDSWLKVVNLLDIAERAPKSSGPSYDFETVRMHISEVNRVAEAHSIDRGSECPCGLSAPEHALLKRKVLTFYRLQIENLKHILE